MGPIWSAVFVNKVYWNTARHICLSIVSDSFYVTTAELSSCDRDYMDPKVPSIWPLKKKLSAPVLDQKANEQVAGYTAH